MTAIAAAMGWELDSITEDTKPVVADKQMKSDFITVQAGQVAGVRQIGIGKREGEKLVRLEFEAYLGAPESYDTVYISGIPDMEVTIKGGTFGDIATAAIVINAIPRVLEASPGLMTMIDIP
jgi:4-hydroxy-tetrahydrodipicolinate reductase